MEPGQVVEFIENNKFTLAVCLQSKGERISALTQGGREINLGPSRLMHLSREVLSLELPRTRLLDSLKERCAMRDEIKSAVDPYELWDLVQGEEEGLEVSFLADILFGNQANSDHEAALLRALLEDKVYFKYREGRIFPREPAQVDLLINQREQEARREKEIEQGAAWLRSIWEGNLNAHVENKDEIIEALKQVALENKTQPLYKKGKDLLQRAALESDGIAFETLVRLGVWFPDQNLDIFRYEIPTEHPDEVLKETGRLVSGNSLEQHRNDRIDMTGEYVITIDGMATRDFDDALSLAFTDRGYRLGVHIADVSSYV